MYKPKDLSVDCPTVKAKKPSRDEKKHKCIRVDEGFSGKLLSTKLFIKLEETWPTYTLPMECRVRSDLARIEPLVNFDDISNIVGLSYFSVGMGFLGG